MAAWLACHQEHANRTKTECLDKCLDAQCRVRGNLAKLLILNGGEYRNRTGVHGFAIRPLSQEKQKGVVSKPTPTNRELNEKVSNAELTGAKENAAAAGPRNGAQITFEAGQLPANDTASLAARHPIIALHWGIVA